jgi:hypothetical protein
MLAHVRPAGHGDVARAIVFLVVNRLRVVHVRGRRSVHTHIYTYIYACTYTYIYSVGVVTLPGWTFTHILIRNA